MEDLLSEINEYLHDNGYNSRIHKDNSIITIKTNIMVYELYLDCHFPSTFPYYFPKIFIKNRELIGLIPHVDNKGFICTFDTDISSPNYSKPKEVTLECIKKAISIISYGLNGLNKDDFKEEFNAYWSLEKDISAYTFFIPGDSPQILHYFVAKDILFISDNTSKLREFLVQRGFNRKDLKYNDCLYLPLKCSLTPPFPKNNKDFFKLVKGNVKCYKAYNKFLTNRCKKSVIIFSHLYNGNISLAGWIHKPINPTINGFRRGKVYPELVYLGIYKNEEVLKIDIARLDKERLFHRADNTLKITNKKVNLIGCGSIGSNLIQGLANLGLDNFTLIDNDKLSYENISRHICGFVNVGEYKTKAIKKLLQQHYPLFNCLTYEKNIIDLLNDESKFLNSADYNFVAIGYAPVEEQLLDYFNQGVITKPIIFIWVEPYLIGGHALIIKKPRNIYKLIMDKDGQFKDRVLVNGQKFSKREAGCQSTYIPYSANEIQLFISTFIDYFYNEFIESENDGNYIFSWCGRIDWARKNNLEISDHWLSSENRTIKIRKLDTNSE